MRTKSRAFSRVYEPKLAETMGSDLVRILGPSGGKTLHCEVYGGEHDGTEVDLDFRFLEVGCPSPWKEKVK